MTSFMKVIKPDKIKPSQRVIVITLCTWSYPYSSLMKIIKTSERKSTHAMEEIGIIDAKVSLLCYN